MNTAEKTEPTSLDLALHSLREAKAAEAEANSVRVEAEKAVIVLMGDLKDEGTNKAETSYFKVSVTTKLNRTIADEAALLGTLPEPVGQRLVRYKASLDLKELRHLQGSEPEMYAAAAKHIIAKPSKPAVKVEEIV